MSNSNVKAVALIIGSLIGLTFCPYAKADVTVQQTNQYFYSIGNEVGKVQGVSYVKDILLSMSTNEDLSVEQRIELMRAVEVVTHIEASARITKDVNVQDLSDSFKALRDDTP